MSKKENLVKGTQKCRDKKRFLEGDNVIAQLFRMIFFGQAKLH